MLHIKVAKNINILISYFKVYSLKMINERLANIHSESCLNHVSPRKTTNISIVWNLCKSKLSNLNTYPLQTLVTNEGFPGFDPQSCSEGFPSHFGLSGLWYRKPDHGP